MFFFLTLSLDLTVQEDPLAQYQGSNASLNDDQVFKAKKIFHIYGGKVMHAMSPLKCSGGGEVWPYLPIMHEGSCMLDTLPPCADLLTVCNSTGYCFYVERC